MSKIGYGYGSEWHLLRYLGYHRNYLNSILLKETNGININWSDFPFTNKNKPFKEERELIGIEFEDSRDCINKWKEFWPQTGTPPNWDAIGKLYLPNHTEWLLVEAKSHITELETSCSAKNEGLGKIINAFKETQKSFRINNTPIGNWLSPYYQYCNRLAVLHFFMRVCEPAIPAHLIFIYFIGDKYQGKQCPLNMEEWYDILNKMYQKIGFVEKNLSGDLSTRIHNIFLPINPKYNI